MRKNILNSLFFTSCVLLIWGCKPKKQLVKAPAPNDTLVVVADKKIDNLNALLAKDFPFQTLSLRSKAQLNINGNENNVTINFRIKKDEKIWFSIAALGGAFEVARGIISPDSLLLMNRIQKTVIRKPFSYLHNYTNSQINFGWLQSILIGNTIKELAVEKSDLKQENGVWLLSGTAEDLAYRTLFNTLLKPTELTLNDARAAQGLKVSYNGHILVNEQLFPSDVRIASAVGNKKISVAVEFVKMEANMALEFPFSVPKSFELIH